MEKLSWSSRVSIKTLDFARIQPTFYRRDQSWITGRGMMRGIARRPPMLFPANARIPSIDIVGDGTPETLQQGERDRWSAMADRPADDGMGNSRPFPPLSDAAGQLVDVVGGWARKMAGSGRVSSAVAHLSKCRHGVRREVAILTCSETPGTGDPRPAVGYSQTIGRISVLFLVSYRSKVSVSLSGCLPVCSF